ncbi:MAG: PTS sugar transporter subunit IIA [Candidatus Brocadiia bacterium]|jgi:PTS system nitrogen regulatory IIA component
MHLSVKRVARALNVSEKTIYRWIDQSAIPVHHINDQYRFNSVELLEWASARKMHLSPELLAGTGNGDSPQPSLRAALELGGVHYGLGGEEKSSVLRAVVRLLPLPTETDRESFFQLLLAREMAGSTAVGDGIAVPHVRNPIVLSTEQPAVMLCFLAHPVDFGSLDGQPVSVLFTLVSPTIRAHLHLLSLLSFALRDPRFKSAVLRHAASEEILDAAANAEAGLPKPPAPGKDD